MSFDWTLDEEFVTRVGGCWILCITVLFLDFLYVYVFLRVVWLKVKLLSGT
jgi:hypothetical protein